MSFSGISNTYFETLELSGSFDPYTSVFPQYVFTELKILPQLEQVLDDGRMTLNLQNGNGEENMPLVSMTLFGRTFWNDGPPPEQWCPHGEFPPFSEQRCLNKRCPY